MSVKISYDKQADVLYVLGENEVITNSIEEWWGTILNMNRDGHVCGLQLLEASKAARNAWAMPRSGYVQVPQWLRDVVDQWILDRQAQSA